MSLFENRNSLCKMFLPQFAEFKAFVAVTEAKRASYTFRSRAERDRNRSGISRSATANSRFASARKGPGCRAYRAGVGATGPASAKGQLLWFDCPQSFLEPRRRTSFPASRDGRQG